jgi:hypothetical protein
LSRRKGFGNFFNEGSSRNSLGTPFTFDLVSIENRV